MFVYIEFDVMLEYAWFYSKCSKQRERNVVAILFFIIYIYIYIYIYIVLYA